MILETKQELDIFSIHIPSPPPADENKINALVASIRENGLISPIAVSPDHFLLAGYHRLVAFQRLHQSDGESYRHIPVRIVDRENGPEFYQIETTEKLFHPGLTILEKATYFKQYFDGLKYGQNRHKTTEIFKTLDISRRTFFNLRAIAERLSCKSREQILKQELHDLANSSTQLLALCKFDEEHQLAILSLMKQQGCGTIFEAIRLYQQEPETALERKTKQKFLKSPSLKLDKDLQHELIHLSERSGMGQNELFNEIFEAGLELIQQKYR